MSLTLAVERPVSRDDELRAPAGCVRFLDLPARRVLAIDGEGPPEDPPFQVAMGVLYPIVYTLRFALKRRRGLEIRVGALEGVWWTADDPAARSLGATLADRPAWRWTLLIGLPDEATEADTDAAIDEVRKRKAPPGLDRLRVETPAEGHRAQILHVGPYSAELPTIERLHAAIGAAGLRPRGRHHEIYLGDPRRSAPERLRTLLRQPVE